MRSTGARVVATLAVATLMLLAAIALLSAGVANAAVATLYSAAVSGYSTVLVFYPARGGRPGLAAALYAIAGWLGSGLGVALGAQSRTYPALACRWPPAGWWPCCSPDGSWPAQP